MELLVSAIAATLTTVAIVPQAIHILRLRETQAISLQMYLVLATGVAFWMIYGFMIWNWAMIIANAITLTLTIAIIAMKLRYG
ncbi:MAG: SemiSWEET transporter [Methyloceanibacter sp.]|jgi:MtN3 and saliva related transmembrane protein|nr:SemiSWEET transporter [Methyloceanibacter sp.]